MPGAGRRNLGLVREDLRYHRRSAARRSSPAGCSETKRLAGLLVLDATAETVTIEGKVLVTVVRRAELLGGGGDH